MMSVLVLLQLFTLFVLVDFKWIMTQFSILCGDDDRCHLVNDLVRANRLLYLYSLLLMLCRMRWTPSLFGYYCCWSPAHLCAKFFPARVRQLARFVYSIDPSFRRFENRTFDRTLWHFHYLLERVCKLKGHPKRSIQTMADMRGRERERGMN